MHRICMIGRKSGRTIAIRLPVLVLVNIFVTCLGLCVKAVPASSSEQKQTAQIMSVRKALWEVPYSVRRHSVIQNFEVYFAVRIADQTYCGDYWTVVPDDMEDLLSCNGKNVEIALGRNKKTIAVYTPRGRKLQARIVKPSRCSLEFQPQL